jgi:hypothetical protein
MSHIEDHDVDSPKPAVFSTKPEAINRFRCHKALINRCSRISRIQTLHASNEKQSRTGSQVLRRHYALIRIRRCVLNDKRSEEASFMSKGLDKDM